MKNWKTAKYKGGSRGARRGLMGALWGFVTIGFLGVPEIVLATDIRLIEVAQAVWASGVNRETKEHTGSLASSVKVQPLYLWIRIKGGKEALDRLDADGLLPIRHKWFRKTIAGINAEGVLKVTDEIEVPAAKKSAIAALRWTVEREKHFFWRTWTMKNNISRGEWRVRIVYANDTPVLCDGDKPCEFSIEVR